VINKLLAGAARQPADPKHCRLWTFGISKNVEEDDAISSESVDPFILSQ